MPEQTPAPQSCFVCNRLLRDENKLSANVCGHIIYVHEGTCYQYATGEKFNDVNEAYNPNIKPSV